MVIHAPYEKVGAGLGLISIMERKNPHYLRSCRRRAALSQRDIAFLLGVTAISKISRYERNVTLPPIRTALAYQVICGRSMESLFRGAYESVRAEVHHRAALLLEHAPAGLPPALIERRKESLKAMLHK